MKAFLLLSAFCLNIAFAQTEIKQATIDVTGTSEMKIIPDEIYISITLLERMDGKVKITVENQEMDLKKAVTELQIPLNQLTLSSSNADYVSVGFKRKEVISRTNYSLMVKTAREVGLVFEKLDSLEIKNARISHTDHSKMEEFRKEVKIQAIKAAKDKADYLLAAIGETRGAALFVEENEFKANYGSYNVAVKHDLISKPSYAWEESKDGDKLEKIEFSKITLSANVHVIFEIKK